LTLVATLLVKEVNVRGPDNLRTEGIKTLRNIITSWFKVDKGKNKKKDSSPFLLSLADKLVTNQTWITASCRELPQVTRLTFDSYTRKTLSE
jgi:hypothetical protein